MYLVERARPIVNEDVQGTYLVERARPTVNEDVQSTYLVERVRPTVNEDVQGPLRLRSKHHNFFIKNRLLNAIWSTQRERAVRHSFNLRYHLII